MEPSRIGQIEVTTVWACGSFVTEMAQRNIRDLLDRAGWAPGLAGLALSTDRQANHRYQ